MNYRKLLGGAALAIALSMTAAHASIILTFGENATSSNATPTGASGKATLSFADEGGDVRVSAFVENTTGDFIFGDGATEGVLTAFGFDLVSGASFAGGFLGGTYLDTLILNANASPFGTLDVAGADNNNYNGGNANNALPKGLSDTFSLLLGYSGNAMDLENAFYTALTTDPVLTSALRFQQVNAGSGSDKLKDPDVELEPVPLPATALLLLGGIGGLGALRTVRRKA